MPKLYNRFEAEMMGKAAQAKRDREDERDARQRRHDYKVALIGAVAGGVMGLLASIVFWLIAG